MADSDPQKYRMSFTDRDGVEESHYIVQIPDPGTAEKVKAEILKTRSDLTLRGVNAQNLQVDKVGPQTAADIARVGSTMSGVPKPIKPI